MKRFSAFISLIFDIIVFVLCIALIVVGVICTFTLFGSGSEIGSDDVGNNLGPVETVIVKGTQGFLSGLVIVFGVVALVLTVAVVSFAVFNLLSSVSCFGFLKNGAFKNYKQQYKVRAAMGCDFFIAFAMILAYIYLKMMEDVDLGALLTISLVGGIISLIGAVCKIPLIKERLKPPSNPTDPTNPTNRW